MDILLATILLTVATLTFLNRASQAAYIEYNTHKLPEETLNEFIERDILRMERGDR